jgi:hypothetical protein
MKQALHTKGKKVKLPLLQTVEANTVVRHRGSHIFLTFRLVALCLNQLCYCMCPPPPLHTKADLIQFKTT